MTSAEQPPSSVGARADRGTAQEHASVPTRRPPPGDVVAYTVIAYLITWLIVGPLAASGLGAVETAVPSWLHPLGAVGPAIAAVVVLARTGGRGALRRLWIRVTDPRRIGGIWWVAALSPLLLGGGALAFVAAFGGLGTAEGATMLAGVGTSLAFGVFEEIGWRGFLLPRLQARHDAVTAAGWLFVVWAAWHLPMLAYRLPGGVMAVGWLVGLYFGSVWMTVLHNGTGGSVLACILWHATYDLATTSGAELSPLLPAAVTALVVVGTIIAVRRVGPADLCRGSRFALDVRGRPV